MTKEDYTDGKPFIKWFFSNKSNVFIVAAWGLAMFVMTVLDSDPFLGSSESIFGFSFITFIQLFNLFFSYREWRDLKNGIIK